MSPFTKKMLPFFFIVSVIVIFVTGVLVHEFRELKRFETEAVKVSGVVTEKSVREDPKRRKNYKAKGHKIKKKNFVYYEYTDANGVSRNNADTLSKEEWDTFSVGQQVAIEYLPDAPDAGRLEDPGNKRAMKTLMMFVAIGYGIAFIGLFVPFLTWKIKQRRQS